MDNYDDGQQNTLGSVLTYSKQASQQSKIAQSTECRAAYKQNRHNSLETAEQLEEILNKYRQDLKQEFKTQLDCNYGLITRLVDFIRPVYSLNQKDMDVLEKLYEEILTLDNVRFNREKEKNEQLHDEILHLKKLIITPVDEENIHSNTMTKIYKISKRVCESFIFVL